MTQDHRENLSAGMDGELSPEALRFLLRRLDHDTAMQQAWSRYHVIRDGLRHELPAFADNGFAERVMRAIDSEAGAPKAAKPRHWIRWSAGGAIAASVAVVALMATQPAGSPADHAAPRLAANGSRPAGMTLAHVAPHQTAPAASPAAVPTWLRDNSGVSLLSERATATSGAPSGDIVSPYASSLQPYQMPSRYRTLNNHDGSYLLLIDTDQKQGANQGVPTQARAAVH